MNRETAIYYIEANIGAGKSTLGAAIKATGRADFITEPTDQWQHGFPENILELFYSDQKRWSFMFQLMAFVTRTKTHKEVLALSDHSNVFIERSVLSDRFIFAETLHESGMMSETEFAVYSGMWHWLNDNFCVEPDKIIYLKASPETCLERITRRARGEETGITIDYLRLLESKHDLWLTNNPKSVILDAERLIDPEALLDKLNIA